MKHLRKIQVRGRRGILIACPTKNPGGRALRDSEIEVAFGDVMDIMPRAMRFPADLTKRLPNLGGPKFISCTGLASLVDYNKDDTAVASRLQELIEHIRKEARDGYV